MRIEISCLRAYKQKSSLCVIQYWLRHMEKFLYKGTNIVISLKIHLLPSKIIQNLSTIMNFASIFIWKIYGTKIAKKCKYGHKINNILLSTQRINYQQDNHKAFVTQLHKNLICSITVHQIPCQDGHSRLAVEVHWCIDSEDPKVP